MPAPLTLAAAIEAFRAKMAVTPKTPPDFARYVVAAHGVREAFYGSHDSVDPQRVQLLHIALRLAHDHSLESVRVRRGAEAA